MVHTRTAMEQIHRGVQDILDNAKTNDKVKRLAESKGYKTETTMDGEDFVVRIAK